MKVVLCALVVCAMALSVQGFRASGRVGAARRQAATCSVALDEKARRQRCDAALAFVLELERSLGGGARAGNETEPVEEPSDNSSDGHASQECKDIDEDLEELKKVQKSCDADPTCWPRMKSHLDMVKSVMERRKAQKKC
mmetsp:Transcript_107909/g.336570  ORF Transcript_107909/g.336570 Transcript_107909/m.336570 type:complete len:140 (+) Transcript_107909:140-559(+)